MTMVSERQTGPVALLPLQYEVLDGFEDCDLTASEWDAHVERTGGGLYMSSAWCRIWWRHYGAGRRLRLYVFRQDGHIVGIAPMVIESAWLGPLRLKLAKRVGADSALTAFSLPLAPHCAEAAYGVLVEDLLGEQRCDALWLGPVPANDPTLESLRGLCASLAHDVHLARDAAAGVQTLFSLPQTFATYLAGLGRAERQNYGRRFRLLQKTCAYGSEMVRNPVEARSALDEFMTLHEQQWRAEGKLGHFGDWPHSAAFNRDLVEDFARSGRLRLHRLSAEGRDIAIQYAFVFGEVCYWRLTARQPDQRYNRFGLGVIGLVQLIDAMIAEGVTQIEAGIGHYDYKLRFGGEEQEVRSILLVPARRIAILRARLFLKASDLLHLLYYRIWFLRIAPRLKLPRRPLWRLWVRSHL